MSEIHEQIPRRLLVGDRNVGVYRDVRKKYLPCRFKLSLACSGPLYWLYLDDATMAVSGILSFSSPRGDAQVIFGISNPAKLY